MKRLIGYIATVSVAALLAPAGARAQIASPSAVYDPASPNPLVVFVEGPGGSLYDKYWNGTKWVWQDQGTPAPSVLVSTVGSAVYDPASPNPLIVFVVGDNGDLYDKYWNGSAWVWQSQGNPGAAIFGSSAVNDPTSPNPLIDFMGGRDGHLYDKYWDGTTSTWVWQDQGTPPGSTVAYAPSAVYDPTSPNPLIVFVTGDNGHLYDKYWDGTTSTWVWQDQGTPPGTTATNQPNALYDPTSSNPLVAFVTGANGHLFDDYWNGTKWVWQDQDTPSGATVTSAPSAVYDPTSSNPLIVFVEGNNGHLFDKYWDGTTSKWVWQNQGIPPGDIGADSLLGLSAVYDPTSPNPLIVFLVGTKTGDLYDKYWDGTTSTWVWQNQAQP